MLTIHHLDNSRSQRVLWLLEELDIAYEIKHHKRDPDTMLAPETLKRIHPLGKSPIVTDGDVTVAESGAVIEYLVDTYGQHLKPEVGTEAYRRYIYWLHYAEGSLAPPMLVKLLFNRVEHAPLPFFIKPIAKGISKKVHEAYINPQISLHLGYVNSELESRPWFAGDELSAADIQMSFPLEAAAARAGGNQYPAIKAFLAKIHDRPAYKRALEKGGTYALYG